MKTSQRPRTLLIVVGISLGLTNAFGQVAKQGTVKFDEFGYTNHENYSAHLDNIAVALQSEPASQGYFIFYNGRKSLPGAAFRYMKRLQNYMVNARGIEPSRMIVLDGGRREEISVEFWTSTPGSTAPAPTPTISAEPAKTKSYLYDRYNFDCQRLFQPKVKGPYYEDDCGYAGMDYEDQSARLDGFIKTIRETPESTARLVVFFLPRDAPGRTKKFIQQERDYLVSKGGLKASSIAVVSRRAPKSRWVDLWVVYPGTPGKVSP